MNKSLSTIRQSTNRHGKIIMLLMLLFSYACSSTDGSTGLPVGENLILPSNDKISGWQESVINVDNYQLTQWQSNRGDRSDVFSLRESFDKPRDLATYRKLTDSAGGSNCVSFNSNELAYANNTKYPALMWMADCRLPNDGKKLQRLYLIIQGNDKFYHLQRNWQNPLSQQDIAWWQQYFTQVYVCNTNDQPQTCPSRN